MRLRPKEPHVFVMVVLSSLEKPYLLMKTKVFWGTCVRTPLGVLVLILLAVLALPSGIVVLESESQGVVTVVVPSNESFTLSIDLKVVNYSTLKPSLEIVLDSESAIVLYLNEHVVDLLPGVYLFNDSKVCGKELMLEAGKWYSIVIEYDYTAGNLTIYLKPLNASFIATEVRHVTTLFNQGLAFGNDSWFFTHTATLCRLSRNLSKTIKCNFGPILWSLRKKGYFHLGDLDYYNGLLVIPIEKTGYTRPAVIGVYDSNTLKLVNYSYTPQDHMPWIALDSNGYIYTSEYSPVDEIYVYHIDQIGFGNRIEPVKVIKLEESLKSIQGGVVVEDELLALTSDDGDHIYFIDIGTGKVVGKVRLPGLYEMEGIEYIREGDRDHFYVLFNTQGLDKNVLYRYQRIEAGERIDLLNVSGEPPKSIRIVYDNKTVVLGNVGSSAPSPRGGVELGLSYIPIAILTIAVLLIGLIVVRKLR